MTGGDFGGLTFAAPPHPGGAVNVLLYGPPGSGKSTAAATAPGPIVWLNAEGPGALGFARRTARARGTDVHEVRLAHDTDPRDALRELVKHVRSGASPQPATLVVDTLGKVREGLIRCMVRPGSRDTLQQFGEVARVLGTFVRLARDLPCHVVLLAHESVEDADGERIVRPLIGGQLTEAIPAEMDIMAACGVAEDGDRRTWIGQLVEGKGRRAKDRSGGLGAWRELDLSEWFAAFGRALGEPVDEPPLGDHLPVSDPQADADADAAWDADEPDSGVAA